MIRKQLLSICFTSCGFFSRYALGSVHLGFYQEISYLSCIGRCYHLKMDLLKCFAFVSFITCLPTICLSRNYSVSLWVKIQPTRNFLSIPHNVTHVAATIHGHELGLTGRTFFFFFSFSPFLKKYLSIHTVLLLGSRSSSNGQIYNHIWATVTIFFFSHY